MKVDLNFLKAYNNFIAYRESDHSKVISEDKSYKVYSKIVKHEEEATDFTYRINNSLFRSLDFNTIPEKFILTAGCSVTFGQGLPEEYRWGSLVSQKIGLPVYDISAMGLDATGILKNITSFISQYNKPEYILIFFPMVNRFKGVLSTKFIKDSEIVFSQPLGGKTKEELVKWINLKENLVGFFDFVSGIRMLETYCSEANIKLLWSNWDDSSCDLLDDFEFNNYIGKVKSDNIFDIKKSDNDLTKKYWDWALDERHPGILYQTHAATKFYSSM